MIYDKNLVVVDAKKIFEEACTDYGAFVIQRRSTPDARDCFKFTQRQIMYAQYINKLRYKDKRQKSQKSVAAAMSHSYVHGDVSAYSVIIHLTRPFYTRYFMQDFVGGIMMTGATSYGSLRYTETKLSLLAEAVFNYLKEDGITKNDWNPTFDDDSEYPTLFPSVGYYNICNGTFGSIGVGISSSIPQFNMKEINKAICDLIDDQEAEVSILPDFASHGIIMNPKTTLQSLSKGEGKSILMRGKIVKHRKEGYLVVHSLPYGVYTDTVCSKLADNMETSNLIKDFKDLSQDAVNIRIYSSDLDKLEAWLYKNTAVQNHFTINMVMLDKGKVPKTFSLKEALLAHIEHASAAYRRQYEFHLNKLKLRQEILEGLIKVHSIIDQVVACIKGSNDRADAIANLVNQFGFSARVSEAVVELKLHRFTSLDIQKLRNELTSNLEEQDRILTVLNDHILFKDELKQIYKQTAEQFGDKRKTQIYEGDEYETDNNGSVSTRDFYLAGNKTMFWADNAEDGEIFDTAEDDDKKSKILVTLSDEVIIICNTGRVFLRTAQDFKIGHMKWSEIISLKDDETVVKFWEKKSLPKTVVIDGKRYDNSFIICSATKRGRKFKTGKWDIKEITEA